MVADGRYAAGMPIYEFACTACDADFEELVAIGQADRVACPACGSRATERRLSTFQRVRVAAGAAAPARSGHGGCCGGACGH